MAIPQLGPTPARTAVFTVPEEASHAVRCSSCGAPRGAACRPSRRLPQGTSHPPRWEAYHRNAERAARVRDLEAAAQRKLEAPRRVVVEVRRGEERHDRKERGGSYQLELIACGKKKCKCNRGALHGPYWYEYRWSVRSTPKRLVSRYIGKPGSPAAIAAGLDKQLRIPGC